MALLIHDPRYVEKPRKRAPITVSHWQQGCDDAKAGRPYSPPSNRGEHDRRNAGYANGYNHALASSRGGATQASTPLQDDPGYVDAFYRMASALGLSTARTDSPETVFKRDMLPKIADQTERIHQLERSVAELLILINEWEPDHASPEDLAKIRRARWAIGNDRLTAHLKEVGRLT